MHCEIEFLPVGEKSRAGDAIVVRYGQEYDFKIMLVDGGAADTGDEIVAHLRRYYGDAVDISDVVLTHSDADHASGLRTVLRELAVERLWLHVPWDFAADARKYFQNKQWTDAGSTAFVSAPRDDDQHPRKIAKNAFIRRGGRVIATQGYRKVFYGGFQQRAGYKDISGESISTQVEDYG